MPYHTWLVLSVVAADVLRLTKAFCELGTICGGIVQYISQATRRGILN